MLRNVLLFLAIFSFVLPITGHSQLENSKPEYCFVVHEDNDFLNLLVPATDRAYTNGTALDLYFAKNHKSKFFVDKWLPKACKNGINVFGYTLKQLMITPNDLNSAFYQKNDYPYSGALYVTHSLYSYDTMRNYDLQTTILGGVMGQAALARQFQDFVHTTMGFISPAGWGNQYNSDILLNLNFTAEKLLTHWYKTIELIGTGNAYAGTMLCGIGENVTLRIGKMAPYFHGVIRNISAMPINGGKKWQLYGTISAGTDYMLLNSVYEGGVFSNRPIVPVEEIKTIQHLPFLEIGHISEPYIPIKHVQTHVSCSIVFVKNNYSISFTQTRLSPVLKGLYKDWYGTVSISKTW